jgi:hypothetical protein
LLKRTLEPAEFVRDFSHIAHLFLGGSQVPLLVPDSLSPHDACYAEDWFTDARRVDLEVRRQGFIAYNSKKMVYCPSDKSSHNQVSTCKLRNKLIAALIGEENTMTPAFGGVLKDIFTDLREAFVRTEGEDSESLDPAFKPEKTAEMPPGASTAKSEMKVYAALTKYGTTHTIEDEEGPHLVKEVAKYAVIFIMRAPSYWNEEVPSRPYGGAYVAYPKAGNTEEWWVFHLNCFDWMTKPAQDVPGQVINKITTRKQDPDLKGLFKLADPDGVDLFKYREDASSKFNRDKY